MRHVEIFTDGACKGNPGKGGWGALLRYGKAVKELSGYEEMTTNNRMELTAVIQALLALKEPCKAVSNNCICIDRNHKPGSNYESAQRNGALFDRYTWRI